MVVNSRAIFEVKWEQFELSSLLSLCLVLEYDVEVDWYNCLILYSLFLGYRRKRVVGLYSIFGNRGRLIPIRLKHINTVLFCTYEHVYYNRKLWIESQHSSCQQVLINDI